MKLVDKSKNVPDEQKAVFSDLIGNINLDNKSTSFQQFLAMVAK